MKITLRELCEKTGVTRRIIQGYEKENLISSNGTNKMGYLLYEEGVVDRVLVIRFYQKCGLSLKEISCLSKMPLEEKRETLKQLKTRVTKQKDETEKLLMQIDEYLNDEEKLEIISM